MTIARALAPGIEAVRANWRPFAAIQIGTAAVVFAYYLSPGFREASIGLARLKETGGYLFSAVAGAIAGGVIPEIAKAATTGRRTLRAVAADALYNGFVFAVIGVQVDALYKLQGAMFGLSHAPLVLGEKVAVDQLGYTTLMSIPLTIGLLRWRGRFRA